MIDDLLVKKNFIVKKTEDGYLISDLDLVVLLLTCFEEFSCYTAIPNKDNPKQILFKVTGDMEKLDKVINSLKFTNQQLIKLTEDEEKRINFANKINMVRNHLKVLIDKVKGLKENE